METGTDQFMPEIVTPLGVQKKDDVSDFEKGAFEKETQPDNKPAFCWQEILKEIFEENQVESVDLDSETWESLEPQMREQIILRYYLRPIEQFARSRAPEVWNYVKTYCEGFVPDKSGDLANVHEGSTNIKINPDALRAEALSGNESRMSATLARIAHEAKHIEFNGYLTGKTSLPEDKDRALAERSYPGYMMREEKCWRYEEGIYHELTGKELVRKWEDVREIYSKRYR